MSELREKRIPVQGCQVYCLQDTAGDKKDVVLLHGAKFSASNWRELGTLEVLADAGHRVHALDMPGYGNTAKCRAAPADLLQAVLEHEELQRPVVVGPSMGGAYSLALYFAAPERIGGLVLVGTVGVDKFQGRLREIGVPCLIVWGELDTVSPIENAYFLSREIEDSRLVILEGARHPCYLDQPQKWHEELLDYLDG